MDRAIQNALDTLEYIDNIKSELRALLHSKTRLIYSGMHVTTTELEHATTCIDEIIDDMLRVQIKEITCILECAQTE